MRASHLVLAIVALALSAPAAGQELQPGTRVRISAPIIRRTSRFTGRVVGEENGRVTLRLDHSVKQDTRADSIVIPRELIRRVEVSLGVVPQRTRAPAARAGAIAGLLVGVGVGLVIGAETGVTAGDRNPWTTALWTAPLGALAGAGVGAAIGVAPHEQWETVRPPRPTTIAPPGPGMRLGLRLGI